MSSLVLQPTDVAQWHALVNEAQAACECNLGEALESYLVFLLMRFSDRPEIARRIMALEFLEAQYKARQQEDQLRDVGDQCLLFSGLFPKVAEKRMVRISYFGALGRTAYDQLSALADHRSERLYACLAEAFVAVMDVLQAMRGLSGETVLEPLAAAELWQDTGSRSARRILGETTQALPARDGRYRQN